MAQGSCTGPYEDKRYKAKKVRDVCPSRFVTALAFLLYSCSSAVGQPTGGRGTPYAPGNDGSFKTKDARVVYDKLECSLLRKVLWQAS